MDKETDKHKNQNINRGENTPYDDVFRTLLNDCSELMIPVVNEVFHEYYTGKEKLLFHTNEHFMNQQDGQEEKRVTDTYFDIESISDKTVKKYHIECQSTIDHSMLVRIFEYATQIALDDGKLENRVLEVIFPNSAILYLRSNRNTPDDYIIQMITPGGSLSYRVPTIKIKDYSLQEIFNKNLLFFIPFYLFRFADQFKQFEVNTKAFQDLLNEYKRIRFQLDKLSEQKIISEYEKRTLIEMSEKVVSNLAKNYEFIVEGVKNVMGGQILDYEAKDILNQGIEIGEHRGIEIGEHRGIAKGIVKGIVKGIISFALDLDYSSDEIASVLQNKLNISYEQANLYLQDYYDGKL